MSRAGRSRLGFVAASLLVSLLVAGVLSGFASPHPDGLESVAAAQGFLDDARSSLTAASPLADYAVAGIGHARLSGALAGIVGCLLTFALVTCLTRSRAQDTRN